MLKDVLFSYWAPAGADWSNWVKPVLFAGYNGQQLEPLPLPEIDVAWAPPAEGRTALVIDLPGALGVHVGLALAQRGYRPVPLYNAVLPPPGVRSVVDGMPILAALVRGVDQLKALSIPSSAPPAFLLDADRRFGEPRPAPPAFDNRSVCFPTDFPSAMLLQTRGITRAMLVQAGYFQPQPDVGHTLRLWQRNGIELSSHAVGKGAQPKPLSVFRPSVLGWIGYRVLMLLRLRTAPLGGFGGMLNEASSG